jgi:hypothetical protein
VITRLGSIFTRKGMRLVIGAFALLAMAGMVFGFALPDAALAWDNCPKGLANDPYPGACRRYVDTNGDDVNHHQGDDRGRKSGHDQRRLGRAADRQLPLGPCISCRACVSISVDVRDGASTGADTSADDVSAAADTTTGGSSILTHYLVAPIAVAFLLIYGVSFVLHKIRKVRITAHRIVWNVRLLGTFLVTGIFGLILTIKLDFT